MSRKNFGIGLILRGVNSIPLYIISIFFNYLIIFATFLPISFLNWYLGLSDLFDIFSIAGLVFTVFNVIIIGLLFLFASKINYDLTNPDPNFSRFKRNLFIGLGIQLFLIIQGFIYTGLFIDAMTQGPLFIFVENIRIIVVALIQMVAFFFHFVAWNNFISYSSIQWKQNSQVIHAGSLLRTGYLLLVLCYLAKFLLYNSLILGNWIPEMYNLIETVFPILLITIESLALVVCPILTIIGDIKLGNLLQKESIHVS